MSRSAHQPEPRSGRHSHHPSLALPEGTYPLVEQELVVAYGTALSLVASGDTLCRLPLQLPFG